MVKFQKFRKIIKNYKNFKKLKIQISANFEKIVIQKCNKKRKPR